VKTGVQSIANIYQGVVSAVYEIGSGISKGTTKVVAQKYGEEAGEAADDVLEGAGNVVKICRIPQDQAADALK
jgi:Na+-driven multidrug efflux pump